MHFLEGSVFWTYFGLHLTKLLLKIGYLNDVVFYFGIVSEYTYAYIHTYIYDYTYIYIRKQWFTCGSQINQALTITYVWLSY